MTAAVRAQLAAAGAKVPPEARKGTAKPRTPAASIRTPPQPSESIVEPEITEDTTPPPTVAETHYIGRYQLNVASGTHYPGRMRAVLVGPTDPKLLDYITAALHQYTKQP